jgi:hypothetical protein
VKRYGCILEKEDSLRLKDKKGDRTMIGCDPEAFVVQDDTVIPGTIIFPNHVKIGNLGYVCHDGVQIEYNPYPQKTAINLARSLTELVAVSREIIENEYGKVEIKFVALQDVPLDVIEEAGKADKSALIFGCSPDINVWNDEDHSFRGDASQLPLRFGGGHIHLNIEGGRMAKAEMVRKLERTVGLVVNANSDQDHEATRRNWYGKSGACRIKDYGAEWRCPSSAIFKSLTEPASHPLLDYLVFMEKCLAGKCKDLLSDEEVAGVVNSGGTYSEAWSLM